MKYRYRYKVEMEVESTDIDLKDIKRDVNRIMNRGNLDEMENITYVCKIKVAKRDE